MWEFILFGLKHFVDLEYRPPIISYYFIPNIYIQFTLKTSNYKIICLTLKLML